MNEENKALFEYERKKLEKEHNGDLAFGLIVSSIIASVILLLMFLIISKIGV